ncbi:MAG: DUF2851 family protein [Bacteroidia bacterium]|nr:DUF2851 family protein [Bacteroidia bacterium]NNJ56041.1 DUF2851 family protein [Bacteroidia bacterium]
MTFDYNENLLQFIWEHQLYQQQKLTTLKGENLTIINQGTLNVNSGPDFENAHIRIGKTDFHGSIEIHIYEKDWLAHNHQFDKAYNNVILHVCYSASKEVLREDGTKTPSLSLKDRLDGRPLSKYENLMRDQSFIPCQNQIKTINPFELSNWLDRMLIERVEERCKRFNQHLSDSNNNWNSVLYMSTLRAFGMPINTKGFEELARKLPFEFIQKHAHSIFQLEALLFGASGLLSEAIPDSYYKSLQEEYSFLKTKYDLMEIATKLKTGRMRPMNLPHIKLAQIAALIYSVPNWTSTILSLSNMSELRKVFSFELSDYWTTHFTFKSASPPKSKKMSKQVTNHLLLNAIIPFVFLFETKKQNGNAEKALEHLLEIPSEKNKIIEQWKRAGINSQSAQNSQALLHLYKTYCKKKLCLNCNIGRKLLLTNKDGSNKNIY